MNQMENNMKNSDFNYYITNKENRKKKRERSTIGFMRVWGAFISWRGKLIDRVGFSAKHELHVFLLDTVICFKLVFITTYTSFLN